MMSFVEARSAQQFLQLQTFGFSNFRKRLGLYSYKISKQNQYKNPHAIPLQQRLGLKKQGYEGEIKIREYERHSQRPFGKVSNKGRFKMEIEKVPFYNIPDLTGFKLKPYVAHSTAKIGESDFVKREIEINKEILAKIDTDIVNMPKGSLVAQQKADPLSRLSRK